MVHPPPLPRDVARRARLRPGLISLTWAILLWERAAPALLRPLGVVSLFLVLAWLGWLTALPGWLHVLVLVGLAVLLAWTCVRDLRGWQLPTRREVERRLEVDADLAHRPLNALRDRPAGGLDRAQAALWQRHLAREQARAQAARGVRIQPVLLRADPYGMRALVCLGLLVAGIIGWPDLGGRVLTALQPTLAPIGTPAQPVELVAWLNPPEHTGLAPIALHEREREGPGPQTVAVPAGSTLLAQIGSVETVPVASFNGVEIAFETVAPGLHRMELQLQVSGELAFRVDRRDLGSWQIDLQGDRAPMIVFTDAPGPSERMALELPWLAADDYGVVAAGAEIRLDTTAAANRMRDPVTLELTVAGAPAREASGSRFEDLTAHPWAGLPVTVKLHAEDGAGLTGESETLALTLPERRFSHPVARAIIAQRKQLVREPEHGRRAVAEELFALALAPEDFNDDTVVFLALRIAASRLIRSSDPEAIDQVIALLWDTALRLEDGDLSLAERSLRDVQQALEEALADPETTPEELAELMDALEREMQRFAQALAEEMARRLEMGEEIPQITPEMAENMLDMQGLQEMLEAMRELGETGQREAAREMLNQMQRMMENLQLAEPGEMSEQMRETLEAMRQLQELTERQQQLMDDTFRTDRAMPESRPRDGEPGTRPPPMTPPDFGAGPLPQPGMPPPLPPQAGPPGGAEGPESPGRGQPGGSSPGGSPPPDAVSLAQAQEELRRELGEIMRSLGEQMGEVPGNLGTAEQEMRGAGRALGGDRPGDALPYQNRALQALRDGQQQMAQQLAQLMQGQGQGFGFTLLPPGVQPGGRDPLGRMEDGRGWLNNQDVGIPDEMERRRVRELLDELRRRRGEMGRSEEELDYLDRLLDRF